MQSDKPYKLLVVEDNPTDVAMLRRALREHDIKHEMTVIDDGETAIEYLAGCAEGNSPDLIVIDLNLPREDGLGVLLKYRFRPALSKVPIVVFTSSDTANDRNRAEMLGADAYICKPSQLEESIDIGAVLRRLLTRDPGSGSAA